MKFFPFVSRTEYSNNYCIFDKDVSVENKQDIESFFPAKIPTVADDVEYEYCYIPGGVPALKVRAKFNADEKTCKDLSRNISGDWLKSKTDNYVAYYEVSAPHCYKHIVFENNGDVEYLYLSFMKSRDAKFGDSFYADGDFPVN